MIERIEWTSKSGRAITMTIELVTRKTIWADGHSDEVETCEIRQPVVTVDGKRVDGWLSRDEIPNAALKLVPDAAAMFGPVIITQGQLAMIDAAYARIHATPEWRAHEAGAAKNRADAEKYDAHQARMRRMMGR
jgi:hypothetical protein